MIRLLTKIFVKDSENIKNPLVRRAYGTMVAGLCIFLNLILFAAKFIGGTLIGSVSICADGMNNLSDAGSSAVSLVCYRISAKPADRDHPFGHARMEYVASMIVSFLILFVGIELVRDSFDKLLHPEVITFNLPVAIALGGSILVKLWMGLFNKAVGNKIDSDAMRATSADSLSDVAATSAVLLANLSTLFLPESVSKYVDPVVGILVACFILLAGFKLLNETKNSILGEQPAEETVEAIRRVVAEYPEALGIHDLVVHNYGPGRIIASLHVEVDGKKNVFDSHDVIDVIEHRLLKDEGIEATIHLDPIITDDALVTEWKAKVKEMVKRIDERIRIHDFRTVPGNTHTNLIFDMEVPFEVKLSDEELKAEIAKEIHTENRTFFAVITVDRV